ncbi:MAG: sulfatase-like hydrolase/transferase [Armatimonadetes bacterium]|nr:sulfatase-like hydrolase/transferase [Armatimonadota bacterium]
MPRPNVLLILVDSARHDACRLNGGAAELPALERLAAGGVNCPRVWATTPICHPARASLITGLHPHAHGMLTNGAFAGGYPFRIHPGTPTLPGILHAHGYRTAYAGQMHIVLNDWDDDRHETTADYCRWLRAAHGCEEAPPREQRAWLCGRVDYPVAATREGRFAERGMALLDDLVGRPEPWFLQLDFDGPHPPCWLPGEFWERYDPAGVPLPATLREDLAGKPEWVRLARRRQGSFERSEAEWRRLIASYLGHLTMIDTLVGRVLDRLQSLGMADDTIVVFTSDHATPVGDHGFAMHGGPPLYEDVLRVPLVVRWPAGLPRGATCGSAVQQVDLAPTLLELADVPAEAPFHGRSAAPALRGEGDTPDESYHPYEGTGNSFFSVRAFRQGRWKLIYTPHGAGELYDLEADPGETLNRLGDPACAAEEAELLRGMLAEMERVGDPLRGTAMGELDG